VPGFSDLADSSLAGNQPLTDDDMVKINQNAKFAAVRMESVYMGWYKNGDVIPTPISPVDGYTYTRTECNMFITGSHSSPPDGSFVSGQAARPTATAPSGAGELVAVAHDIDDSTGTVFTYAYYYVPGGAATATNDGFVKVHCLAMRSSVNVAN
jgi:hypothetical protein